MTSETWARPRRGVLLSLVAGLAVGAWAVHLFAVAALARLDQQHHVVEWVVALVTAVTAVPCVLAIVIGWAAVRQSGVEEGSGSPLGRTVFLGWMAVVTGAFSLLLIVLEAVYVLTIDRHA
jgi:hypothetical protein